MIPTRLAAHVALCVLACAAVSVGGASLTQKSDPDARAWIQLFNGRNLDDWLFKFAHHDLGENFQDTFRVEDGLLKVRYDKWTAFNGEFGHLFYREPFSYYLLAAEYRFVGAQLPAVSKSLEWAARNNGLMLHAPHPKTMLERSGLSDLSRSPAARRPGRWQAPHHCESLHAGYARRHRRSPSHGALHQFHLEDLRWRPVGSCRGRRPRRRIDQARRRGSDGAGILEAANRWRDGEPGRSGSQGGWDDADWRLHRVTGRNGAHRFPEG